MRILLFIFITLFFSYSLNSQSSSDGTALTKEESDNLKKAEDEAKKAEKEAKKIEKEKEKAARKYKKFIKQESTYEYKGPKNIKPNEKDEFVIGYVKYTSSDRTKEERVREAFGSIEQKGFASESDLIAYLDSYKTKLMESRFFASVRYEINEIKMQNNQKIYSMTFNIDDSPVALPVPYALYNTSTGFSAAFISPFPNIGGQLFDFVLFAGYRVPPNEDRSLNWDKPELELSLIFERIKAGPLWISTRSSYFDKGVPVIDRGDKVLEYSAKILTNTSKIEWEFKKNWYYYNSFDTALALEVSDMEIYSNDKKYQIEPYKVKFDYLTGIQYLGAPLTETSLKGHQAKLLVGYSYFNPYIKGFKSEHVPVVDMKYGWYDRVNYKDSRDFYFPSLEMVFHYKSGSSDYTLGRYFSGIFDPLLSGNGVFVITHTSMFAVGRVPKTFEFQMGPLLSYGLTWDDHREFEVYDQGFTIGLKFGFIFDVIPNIPIYLILAEDLRKRPEPAGFGDRFELQFIVSYNF